MATNLTYLNDFHGLLTHFAANISGYTVYNGSSESLNAAATYSAGTPGYKAVRACLGWHCSREAPQGEEPLLCPPLPDFSQVVAVDVTDIDTLNVLKGLGISQMADLTSVRTNLTTLEHNLSLVSLVRLAPTYMSPVSPGIPQSDDCQPGLHGQTRWLWKPHCQLHGRLGLLARVASYLCGDIGLSDFATAALPQPIAKASELIEFAVFAAAPTLEYEVVRQRWFLNWLYRPRCVACRALLFLQHLHPATNQGNDGGSLAEQIMSDISAKGPNGVAMGWGPEVPYVAKDDRHRLPNTG